MPDTEKIVNSTFDYVNKLNPCPNSTYKLFIDFMSFIYHKSDKNIREILKEKISKQKVIEIDDGKTFKLEMIN